MPIYTIETPNGKRLRIEAADEAAAMTGAQQWHSEQSAAAAHAPTTSADTPAAPAAPKRLVYNPATGALE
jgi:hypothetical protein